MSVRFSWRLSVAAWAGLALTTSVAIAQTPPPRSIASRLGDAGEGLAAAEPRFQALDPARRRTAVEFIVGNTLFTLTHELGHAVISVLDLPVLGREEDAADTFATLALLHVGSEFTHGVLLDAARGLLRMAESDAQAGLKPMFFAEHGLDQQRAYGIICLMVGNDPRAFKSVADRAGIPAERQESCVDDFRQAEQSWLRLLQPHLRRSGERERSFLRRLLRLPARAPDGQDRIAVYYREAPAPLAPFRQALVTVGLLEAVAAFAGQNLELPANLALDMQSCGEPNAYWDRAQRRVVVCYELVADYAALALRSAP
jgi:hypothetical protein